MQYYQQDENFDMKIDENCLEKVEALGLKWSLNAESFDENVLKKNFTLLRHIRYNKSFEGRKSKLNYESLVKPFFTDYVENYVERQNSKYDEIITGMRKMLKVDMQKMACNKFLDFQDFNRCSLTCMEIRKQKKRWSSNFMFDITLRYYEFRLNNDEEVETATVVQERELPPPIPSNVDEVEVEDMAIDVSSAEE